ncbi:2-oxoglutarate dehydrogenase, mitochondrial-like [Prorops nasuta]|uniref:2-oxoglutarate dehydrogenase, mitochondrial-like n=1 Tax=Prorops nasuta TaxID=863751 RepID=UPI0034CDA3A4
MFHLSNVCFLFSTKKRISVNGGIFKEKNKCLIIASNFDKRSRLQRRSTWGNRERLRPTKKSSRNRGKFILDLTKIKIFSWRKLATLFSKQIFISSVYQRSNSCEGAYKRSKSIHRCTQETLLAKNIVRLKHNDSGNGRKKSDDSFLSGTNANYLEELYRLWLQDPKSISESWNEYFKLVQQDEQAKVTESSKIITPASFEIPANLKPLEPIGLHRAKESKRNMSGSELQGDQFIKGTLDLNSTIRAYQTRGHLIADVDPLGIQNPESSKLQGTANLPPAIVVRGHLKGLTEADMNKEFPLGSSTRIGGDKTHLPLREIITRLNKIYCGHLGLEYTYINDLHVLDWLREKFEVPGAWELQPDHRKAVWKDIMRAVTFESFLAKKYGSEKRFGLEGCESFIASTVQVLETSAEKGVESVVMGMAHRGRLSTLVNVCSKPMHQLFIQFNPIPLEGFGSGDVKYHLGTFTQKLLERSKKVISLAIAANPSHLEAVSPCINGRVRAEQVAKNDNGVKSLPILVHGDAAFAGQGIVFETMHQTNLPEYTTGGVIHIVINNQVGFTTDPRYSRSSAHCTDVARVVNAPIFHMHGDDPDLVAYCSQVAAEYRSLFHNDVVLDVVGYRRNGHNEMDEPMLTQPLMYKRIKALPNVLTIYTDKLLKDGIITEAFAKEEVSKFLNYCETEFQMSQTISSMQISDWFDIPWSEFFSSQSPNNKIPPTGLEIEEIKLMCDKLVKPPEKIATHPQILRVMSKRETLAKNNEVDWAMGESLAYLSLLKRGHHIRLSGQDVERGTFSHRMHIVHDQNIDLTWKNVLNDVFPKQALYTVSNSPLSEYGVCGRERERER